MLDGAPQARLTDATNLHERHSRGQERVPKQRVHLVACVRPVALAIGHPGQVRLQQQVEVASSLASAASSTHAGHAP